MKIAANNYDFTECSTDDLYKFAMQLPPDLERSEKDALLRELADRMHFWHLACTL